MSHYENIKTCYQLLTNELTANRPTIENINPDLFPDGGLKEHHTIEITGPSSTGKTFLITELIARCILPKTVQNVDVGGRSCGAILINTDHHFHILQLIKIMQNFIKTADDSLRSEIVNDTITKSLRNLIVLDCFDSHQLYITLHNIEKITAENDLIALIAIDSINAYYWSDRTWGVRKMDLYQKNLLKVVQSVTKDFKLAIVYTGKDRNREECVMHPTLERINYKIHLEPSEGSFIATVTLPCNTTVKKRYEISGTFKWTSQ